MSGAPVREYNVFRDEYPSDGLRWIVADEDGNLICACYNKGMAQRIAKALSK